jgi:hypothetical protein
MTLFRAVSLPVNNYILMMTFQLKLQFLVKNKFVAPRGVIEGSVVSLFCGHNSAFCLLF